MAYNMTFFNNSESCSSIAQQLFDAIDNKGLIEYPQIAEIYKNNRNFGFVASLNGFASIFKEMFTIPFLKILASSNIEHACKYFIYYEYIGKYISKTFNKDDQDLLVQHGFSNSESTCMFYTGMSLKHEGITYEILDDFMTRRYSSNQLEKIEFEPIKKQIFSIWYTSSTTPREMFDEDLNNMIRTKQLFGGNWTYTLFTNDEKLIPISTTKLRANGLEVKSMSSLKSEIANRNKESIEISPLSTSPINDNSTIIDDGFAQIDIENAKNNYGITGNLGRLLINKLIQGGCYADANFAFSRTIDQEVEKYDSVFNNPDSNFFCYAKDHPAVDWALEKTIKNLANPPSYVPKVNPTTIVSFTPFFIANILYYNKASSDYVCSYHTDCSLIGVDNAGSTHQTWSND